MGDKCHGEVGVAGGGQEVESDLVVCDVGQVSVLVFCTLSGDNCHSASTERG